MSGGISTNSFNLPYIISGTHANRPSSGQFTGQIYTETDTGSSFYWSGSAWTSTGITGTQTKAINISPNAIIEEALLTLKLAVDAGKTATTYYATDNTYCDFFSSSGGASSTINTGSSTALYVNSTTGYTSNHYTADTTTPLVIYHLDETSGTNVADSSGNSTAGVSSNCTLSASGAFNDLAYSFNGSNSGITVAGYTLSSKASGTIACWVKFTNFSGSGGSNWIISSGQTGHELAFGVTPSGQCYMNDGVTTLTDDTTTLSTGIWYHLAFSWGASGWKIYVNGTNTKSNGALTSALSAQIGTSTIGYSPAGNYGYINATLDEFRVYNSQLSGATITTIYGYTYNISGIVQTNALTIPTLTANPTYFLIYCNQTIVGTGTVTADVSFDNGVTFTTGQAINTLNIITSTTGNKIVIKFNLNGASGGSSASIDDYGIIWF